MKSKAILFIVFFTKVCSVHAQYISEVLEYVPAPSQYMNAAPWGLPTSPLSIIGGLNGHVSLGAFGGYIVFRFENSVENDPENPFGIDLTIFGNPLPNWAEPGIVSVMKDENSNGLPDDTWYELAGSDYNFSSTIQKYQVTYKNPGEYNAVDVPWSDNFDGQGYIKANSFYLQAYYPLPELYPEINQTAYTLSGTRIASTTDTAFQAGIYSLKRGFGYVDNQFRGKAPFSIPDNPYTTVLENSGGDAFDIDWAVNEQGEYVDLDKIDFVKVYTAVMDGAGWLGQISTEITGAIDVGPDNSIQGNTEKIVIKELPIILNTPSFQLEAFVFRNGRLLKDELINWNSSLPEASIDEENILHVSGSGKLTIVASLAKNNEIVDSVSTTIDLSSGYNYKSIQKQLEIYPNPAKESVFFKGIAEGTLLVFDLSGKIILPGKVLDSLNYLNISDLPQGIYLIQIRSHSGILSGKFIKQ